MTGPILAIDHASKTFPGQVALDGARLAIYPGEVHALVGQNGSGKSTLIKILAGYIAADRGARVQLAGQTVDLWSLPHDLRRRIHVVHQDLGLVPTLSAIENLALGRGFLTARAGRIHWRAEAERAQEELLRFGVAPDVRQPMMSLTAAEQAAVAIVRALQDWDDPAGLLILDEPTASLARSEIDALFRAVHEVADGGAGVLFVSHIIDEVLELADRVTVLRDGRVVGEGVPVADLDADRLVEMIAGRDIDELYAPPPEHIGRKVLEAEMVFGIQLRGVSLHVREREVVGVAGLVGSGRDEIAGALFGVTPRFAGRVLVNKTKVFASPRDSIAAGMALVPADRHGLGTIPEQRAHENLTLPRLEPLTSGTTLVRGREMTEVLHWMNKVEVDPPTPTRKMEKFSGGNQQKLVLARWLRMDPKVLLLDEPTQGVDVGAKASVYRLVADAASDGAAVLVASSDAEELVHMCDRVLVLRAGRLVAELAGSDLTDSRVVAETLGATGNRGAMRASRHRITTTVVRAGDKRPEPPSTAGSDDQPPAEPVPEPAASDGLSSRLGQWGRRALRRVRRT